MPGAANPDANPWANDRGTFDLYRRRARDKAEEMTCAAQAASVLGPLIGAGETLLDAGCGGGSYLWSFRRRGFAPDWWGLDYTPELVDLARAEVALRAGLAPERFMLGAIEDLPGAPTTTCSASTC